MREPTVAESLSSVVVGLRSTQLDTTARAGLTRALLDWFGVALGGSGERPAESLALGLVTGGPARLVGRRESADPALAALVNGTAAHTLELDDIYAPGLFHPGAPIIAAALAAADQLNCSGARLERAVVAGVEAGCRVATDLGPTHYRHWHTTGTAGAVGAAVAVADLLELDRLHTAHAIALAATMASGLQQTFRRGAAGKPLHAGHAAQSGVVAAVAAARGITGALDALEGAAGLGPATGVWSSWSTSRSPDTESLLIAQLTVKPYPCCGHTFAPIDAMLALRAAGLRADDVETIEVATYGTALDVAGDPAPDTVAGARFSIGYTVAVALLDGRVTRGGFAEERIADSRRKALTDCVRLSVGTAFDEAFPARRGASVRVVTRDGATLTREAPDRSGSPENPLSDDAVSAKFTDLAGPVLGASRAAELEKTIRGLAGIASVRDLAVTRDG
ncbi:MAG TPA: MmgE/PrpD family protein [Nocardioides sp.]|nr:MmgE/PrpD family protein [Nocardioides sp.]